MKPLKPVIRWVGGKTMKWKQFKLFFPAHFTTYVEPCLGSGAFFFALQPKIALISDINAQLMNVYECVKTSPNHLINELQKHAALDSETHFYEVRDLFNANILDATSVEQAGRFMYLNCRDFNGLYRVNKEGKFNVGWCHESRHFTRIEPIMKNIPRISAYFNTQNIHIQAMSYEQSLLFVLQLGWEDVFFAIDSPYDSISKKAFTQYDVNTWDAQSFIQMKRFVDAVDKSGFKFLFCNADTPFILDLFQDYSIHHHQVSRFINCDGNGRGKVGEVVITNYDPPFLHYKKQTTLSF